MKNKLDKNTLENIKNILLKKSEGYFYNEEILEYQNDIIETKSNKNEQLNFFKNKNNEEKNTEKYSNLTLIKKKVTTHYVPPDMLAIKMLFENYGEKVDVLENMSDEDVVKLKENLLKELSNYEDK